MDPGTEQTSHHGGEKNVDRGTNTAGNTAVQPLVSLDRRERQAIANVYMKGCYDFTKLTAERAGIPFNEPELKRQVQDYTWKALGSSFLQGIDLDRW